MKAKMLREIEATKPLTLFYEVSRSGGQLFLVHHNDEDTPLKDLKLEAFKISKLFNEDVTFFYGQQAFCLNFMHLVGDLSDLEDGR